ncbi:glutathionylspermidine synthase family protein [Paenibacillus terrigena]|uniref:glutathionylspermidine synthase family protein n=1 Tax=Paenibacillus terrigena TaxID=369333 RepID=UPI0028D55ECF|nr:glutathionylspermidine synthase family protein [Paenibacillus terrigena]
MSSRVIEVRGVPQANRQARVNELEALGFTWANLDQEQYWIDQLVVMNRDTYQELEEASRKLWAIFDKAVRFVCGRHDLYQMISIPEVLWESLDTTVMNEPGLLSRYARFDFAVSGTGEIKLLELNADTPTGYVEAAVATPWMCRQYGVDSPNEQMAKRIQEAWAVERPDTAACVAYGQHAEDSGTINMLVQHSGLDITCVDCLDLWIDEGIVRDASGRQIERMFALYPKEWMAVDDGGDALAYSMEMGYLQLFNPPHAILLQSKGLQALIWGLHELNLMYTPNEKAVIERYMLPTYNKAVFDGSFVSKSMFGREGGSVKIFDGSGQLEVQDEAGFDTSRLFPLIYQKRAELAQIHLESGSFHLLTGMFMINGEPCGLLGRAGGPITGNVSHFVAIGVGG